MCRVRQHHGSALGRKQASFALLLLIGSLSASTAAKAADVPDDLPALFEAPPSRELSLEFGVEKRRAAMRTAALAYGARAGLARRQWELSQMLDGYAPQLGRIFRFRELMLRQDGFMIMPPVIAETRQAFRLERNQEKAASAQRIIRIVQAERIVSAVPDWRDYLLRGWQKPEAPASVLFPRDKEESRLWGGWLKEGWDLGRRQANDVFAADLDRLEMDFRGLILWHELLEGRMVTAPGLDSESIAVSGNDQLVRIGETLIEINNPARLSRKAGSWKPLVEQQP